MWVYYYNNFHTVITNINTIISPRSVLNGHKYHLVFLNKFWNMSAEDYFV